jgi:hypothetical protein
MTVEIWMVPVTAVAIYLTAFSGSFSAFSFLRWKERRFKQRMLEEFMLSLQEKIQTEEDFNSIINKLRKDYGDE